MMQEPEKKKTTVTVATVGPLPVVGHGLNGTKPQIVQKFDSTDYIMDKIDYEFYNAQRTYNHMSPTTTPSKQASATKMVATGNKKKRKPSRKDRLVLRAQGVEFDTGDETSGTDTKRFLKTQPNVADLAVRKGMSLDLSACDTDTGLGTASLQEEGSDLEGPDPKIILGKVDVYSGAEEKQIHPYLDSDVAKELDAQYKQILKKKSGELVSGGNGNGKKTGSDLSSVLTEDLLNKYKQYMVKSASECSFLTKTSKNSGRGGGKDVQMSDLDSIRTEDIEGEFRRTMVKPPPSDISQASKVKSQKLKSKSMAKMSASKIPRITANPLKHKRRREGKWSGMSDVESVKTEDFENSFHKMMVKQIGGVPITSFDQMIIDSDLDTVKSHVIREKLRIALAGNEDIENNETEEEYSSDDDSGKFDTVIDTHKLQELIKGSTFNGERQPSMESVATLQGGPSLRDYSFNQERSAQKPTYSSTKVVKRSIPPPIWEGDESQADDEVKVFLEYPRVLEPPVPSKNSVESIEDRDTMQTSNDSSIAEDFSQYASSTVSSDSLCEPCNDLYFTDYNGVDHNAILNEQPPPRVSMIGGWKDKRQSSMVSSTSRSDATGCTFDEVESIDFDLQHDINLSDIARSLRTLSKKDLHDLKNSEADGLGNNFNKKFNHAEYSVSPGKGASPMANSQVDLEMSSDSSTYSDVGNKTTTRLLIEEDEEGETLPFAKHTFYKKSLAETSHSHTTSRAAEKSEKREAGTKIGLRHLLQKVHSKNRLYHFDSQSSATSSMSLPYHGYSSDDLQSEQIFDAADGFKETENSVQTLSDNGCKSPALMPVGDLYVQNNMYNQNTPAENTLTSLGFSGLGSFLPERFARDWQKKIVATKQQKYMEELQKHNQSQKQNTTLIRQHETRNCKVISTKRKTSDFVHKLDFNSRTNASSRRARFRRVASVLNCTASKTTEGNNKIIDNVEKQDSLDQLKSVLERQANILELGRDKIERRRRQFLSKKQNSLPLFLDTLCEEDIENKLEGSENRSTLSSVSDDQRYIENANKKESPGHCEGNKKSAFKTPGQDATETSRYDLDSSTFQTKIPDDKAQLSKATMSNKKFGLEYCSAAMTDSVCKSIKNHAKECEIPIHMEKLPNVNHESFESDLTEQQSSVECETSLYASSLSDNHVCEAAVSISSSFDMEMEDMNDPEKQGSMLSEVGRRLVASPTTHDCVSLGQTSFGKKNELSPSPVSPRWSISDFEETNMEDQYSDHGSPVFISLGKQKTHHPNESAGLSPTVPAITVSRSSSPGTIKLQSQSSSSLEVAEIMANSETSEFSTVMLQKDTTNYNQANSFPTTGMERPHSLQLVPAMVTVVLNDVGKRPTGNSHGKMKFNDMGSTCDDDFLRAPSPGNVSNLSLSPAPLSPITVIEMDYLDNQTDSIDSGGGDLSVAEIRKEDGNFPLNSLIPDILHPISEASDEGGFSGSSREASFDDSSPQSRTNPFLVDVGVEADDGRLSPIQPFVVNIEDERESAYSSAVPSDPSIEMQGSNNASSDNSPSHNDECNNKGQNITYRNMLEASVQTDLQSLSPIMFQDGGDEHNTSDYDRYYIACEKSVQCSIDSDLMIYSDRNCDKSTQTSVYLEKNSSVSQSIWKDSYEHCEGSFSDFEPQIFQSQGMQTDNTHFDVDINGTGFAKPLLCSACKLSVTDETYTRSISKRIGKVKSENCLSSEEENKTEKTDRIKPHQCNNAEYISDISRNVTGNIKSPTSKKDKLKFSPTLLVQDMLDRSISMTDYIERNISIPENLRLDVPEVIFDRANSVPEYVGGSTSDMINENGDILADMSNNEVDDAPQNLTELVNSSSVKVDKEKGNNVFEISSEGGYKVELGDGNIKNKSIIYDKSERDVGATNPLKVSNEKMISTSTLSMIDSKPYNADIVTSNISENTSADLMKGNYIDKSHKKPNINDFVTTMHTIPGLMILSSSPAVQTESSGNENGRVGHTFAKTTAVHKSKNGNIVNSGASASSTNDPQDSCVETYKDQEEKTSGLVSKAMNNERLIHGSILKTYPYVNYKAETPSNYDNMSMKNEVDPWVPLESRHYDEWDFTSPTNRITKAHKHSPTKTANYNFGHDMSDEHCCNRLKKNSRKRKSLEKVDSWLQNSFSQNLDTRENYFPKEHNENFSMDDFNISEYYSGDKPFVKDCSTECLIDGNLEQLDVSSDYVSQQLTKEKKLLKRMARKSQRWMKYFENMDRHREKLFPHIDFPVKPQTTDDKFGIDTRELSNHKMLEHRYQHKIPAFDLEHLLNRIDKIENMIKTVSNTYSERHLDFETVSRQLNENRYVLENKTFEAMDDEEIKEQLQHPNEIMIDHTFWKGDSQNFVPTSSAGAKVPEQYCSDLIFTRKNQVITSEIENIVADDSFTLQIPAESWEQTHPKEPYQWVVKPEPSSDNTEYLLSRLKEIEESIAMENKMAFENNMLDVHPQLDATHQDIHHIENGGLSAHNQQDQSGVLNVFSYESKTLTRGQKTRGNIFLKHYHAIDETRL